MSTTVPRYCPLKSIESTAPVAASSAIELLGPARVRVELEAEPVVEARATRGSERSRVDLRDRPTRRTTRAAARGRSRRRATSRPAAARGRAQRSRSPTGGSRSRRAGRARRRRAGASAGAPRTYAASRSRRGGDPARAPAAGRAPRRDTSRPRRRPPLRLRAGGRASSCARSPDAPGARADRARSSSIVERELSDGVVETHRRENATDTSPASRAFETASFRFTSRVRPPDCSWRYASTYGVTCLAGDAVPRRRSRPPPRSAPRPRCSPAAGS